MKQVLPNGSSTQPFFFAVTGIPLDNQVGLASFLADN
jgi:hypothetical protein